MTGVQTCALPICDVVVVVGAVVVVVGEVVVVVGAVVVVVGEVVVVVGAVVVVVGDVVVVVGAVVVVVGTVVVVGPASAAFVRTRHDNTTISTNQRAPGQARPRLPWTACDFAPSGVKAYWMAARMSIFPR